MTRRFDTVLVANRGEIAVRVIRGASRLGYKTVAVYSDADRDALHVRLADEAVRIGPPPARESYLSIPAILDAAKASGAQAIHPGYGFLSENAEFARAVQAAGLEFIGPDPDSIAAMGNKSAAKQLMLAAGVPCVPGYQGADQSDHTLAAEAKKIGLPVMIKAAAGGGGRGMRMVHEQAKLIENIRSARSEAENAFGSNELLIEKAVVGARHVEIQVIGDRQGHIAFVGERDCSIQRRHQKVVEESPSPAVDEALRKRMGEAAVAAARAVNYVNAGTVEFLLAPDGQFYFLEMNTRLQVEHPVTELVYGIDLVEWQLRVAQGEPLPLSQQEILARRRGHAIEVRLCAEDVRQNYLPQTGTVLVWRAPAGEGVRVDTYLEDGTVISPHYDSMQAKIIACGESREIARRRLVRALADTVLLGVTCNRDYLRGLVEHSAFAEGRFHTGFIAEHFPPERVAVDGPAAAHWVLAAAALYLDEASRLAAEHDLPEEWIGWHSSHDSPAELLLACGQQQREVDLRAVGVNWFEVTFGEKRIGFEAALTGRGRVRFRIDGNTGTARYARTGEVLWLDALGVIERYADRTYAPAEAAATGADGRVLAHSDGKIAAVHVTPGARVDKGQTLVVLEAMKMEFSLAAPFAGTVANVAVQAGQQVRGRQLLVELRPEDDGASQ